MGTAVRTKKLKSFGKISKTTVYRSGDHLFLPHQYFIFMIRIIAGVIVKTSLFIDVVSWELAWNKITANVLIQRIL